jgi:hypothetical protein
MIACMQILNSSQIFGMLQAVATQGHIPGYQPMVCGGYHLRVGVKTERIISDRPTKGLWNTKTDSVG